jgi:hypothetical protein
MLRIKLSTPPTEGFNDVSLVNEELIKGIISMPDDEYTEILSGILSSDRLNDDVLLRIFAICYHKLSKSNLNPAQRNAFNKFIELCQKKI